MAGLSLHFVNTWMKDDPKVREQVEDAKRLGAMKLESVALQRVLHGTPEPIFYQGSQCGEKLNTHDGLMVKMLDARVQGFRKETGDGQGNTFNGPTQINIMPRADNYAQWLEMKTSTLAKRTPEALPPPVEDVEDAEFTPVTELNPFAGLGL